MYVFCYLWSVRSSSQSHRALGYRFIVEVWKSVRSLELYIRLPPKREALTNVMWDRCDPSQCDATETNAILDLVGFFFLGWLLNVTYAKREKCLNFRLAKKKPTEVCLITFQFIIILLIPSIYWNSLIYSNPFHFLWLLCRSFSLYLNCGFPFYSIRISFMPQKKMICICFEFISFHSIRVLLIRAIVEHKKKMFFLGLSVSNTL